MHQLLNEPLPVFKIYLKNCDFAVDGSPTINIFISPLKWVPFSKFFSTPPNNCKISAFFINECPYIPGAIELAKISKTLFFF